MIEVKYKGRLGNNLFQYCLGRIISQALGFRLNAQPLEGFPGTAEKVIGESYDWPIQVLKGHVIDLPAILKDRRPRKIVLDGYFQRFEYYENHKTEIKKWLEIEIEPQISSSSFDYDDIVVNLRLGGDNKNFWVNTTGMFPLPLSYVEKILDEYDRNKRFIITDSPDDESIAYLKEKYSATIIHTTPLQDFVALKSAKNLAIPMSSFSWWAAWLSDAQKIYFPRMGIWEPALRPDINLLVSNEPRYVYKMPSAQDKEYQKYKWRVNPCLNFLGKILRRM